MVGKPQLPMRVMYARLVGSEAPVALLYSRRARGSRAWSAFTAWPVSEGSAQSQTRGVDDRLRQPFMIPLVVNVLRG